MPEQPPDYSPGRTPEELFERLHKLADKLGELVTPDNLATADIPSGAEVSYHYGYIKNSEGEIEYTKPLPSVRRGKKPAEEFPAATPAKITPSRRKPAVRDHKTIVVFGDSQIDYRRIIDSKTGETQLVPIHDERAIDIATLICKDLQPDVIVNVGDTVDLASLSRFDPDSDHFHKTIGPSFQRAHDMYAQLRADNPSAEIVEVDSNHNTRLRNYVLKHMPQLHDMRRPGVEEEYPVMTYPYLANLGHLGVRFISGYGEANYVYGKEYDAPPIVFKHGDSSAPGSTSAKERPNYPYSHIVRGHSHRADRVYTTMRGGDYSGQYLASIVVGTLCKITGEVPAVHSAVDDLNRPVETVMAWQQGMLVIKDYGGQYTFDDVMIQNGRTFYEGKEYRSEL